MIDPAELISRFQKHAAALPATKYVSTERASFESWFRAELFPVLAGMGYESITTDYTYPGARTKADLAVEGPNGRIVFELKCFVSGADAQKISHYPQQLEQLFVLVNESEDVAQCVAFVTFLGYSERRMGSLLAKLFPHDWNVSGPAPLVPGSELTILVATTEPAALDLINATGSTSTRASPDEIASRVEE